jgi:hypothetical protein
VEGCCNPISGKADATEKRVDGQKLQLAYASPASREMRMMEKVFSRMATHMYGRVVAADTVWCSQGVRVLVRVISAHAVRADELVSLSFA